MPRIIRRPKKVCTINRSGKKKCFTIQARRRMNPDNTVYILTDYPFFRIEEHDDFDAQERLQELLKMGYQAILFEDLEVVKKALKSIK